MDGAEAGRSFVMFRGNERDLEPGEVEQFERQIGVALDLQQD